MSTRVAKHRTGKSGEATEVMVRGSGKGLRCAGRDQEGTRAHRELKVRGSGGNRRKGLGTRGVQGHQSKTSSKGSNDGCAGHTRESSKTTGTNIFFADESR